MQRFLESLRVQVTNFDVHAITQILFLNWIIVGTVMRVTLAM